MHQEDEESEMEFIEAVKKGDVETVREHVDGVNLSQFLNVPTTIVASNCICCGTLTHVSVVLFCFLF